MDNIRERVDSCKIRRVEYDGCVDDGIAVKGKSNCVGAISIRSCMEVSPSNEKVKVILFVFVIVMQMHALGWGDQVRQSKPP